MALTVSLGGDVPVFHLGCADALVCTRVAGIRRNAQQLVIPAKAGRSAKHGERPKGGPEGVNEANSLPRKQGREVNASINSTKCRK